jgi:two-component system, cell cycle response regulator DivK
MNTALNRPRIHVVDDHELSRKHLRTVLEFHGYRVELSADGAAAHERLLQAPPDLVLLDLQMPGESGYELLAWMRGEPTLAQVPAICVTASVPMSERERVQAAGFVAFVPKPITPPARLLDAVQAALAGARASGAPP